MRAYHAALLTIAVILAAGKAAGDDGAPPGAGSTTKNAQGAPPLACKECGSSGECVAAKNAKVAKVLKGENWQSGDGLSYTADADHNGKDIGPAYTGILLKPDDKGFTFSFKNERGDYDSFADFRPKEDQLCLWRIESNGKSRYYYLSHYDSCIGKWTDGPASLSDTKITVYTY